MLVLTAVVFTSNVASSGEYDDKDAIVNHLTISTKHGEQVKSLETEFIGEPEVERLLVVAEQANVDLSVQMENPARRVIQIHSTDFTETLKVYEAFRGSGLERLLTHQTLGTGGNPMLLDIEFEGPGVEPYAVTLAPDVGQWSGLKIGHYLLRFRPVLTEYTHEGKRVVDLSTDISKIESGSWTHLAQPRLTTAIDSEAAIEFGHEPGGVITLRIRPRQPI